MGVIFGHTLLRNTTSDCGSKPTPVPNVVAFYACIHNNQFCMIIKFKTLLQDKTLPPNPVQISCTLCITLPKMKYHNVHSNIMNTCISAYQLWCMQCYRVQGEGCQKLPSFPIALSQNQTPPLLKQAAHH